MNLTWSGVDLYRMLQIMVLSATLLPVPVAPAMSRWGIFSSPTTTGFPMISLPRQMGAGDLISAKPEAPTISLKGTTLMEGLGISMPMTSLPGMGATIRILRALKARARSSARFTILLILIPGAGLYSKVVITGPGSTSMISPLMPKYPNFCSSSSASRLMASWSTTVSWQPFSRKSREGRRHVPSPLS